MRPGASYPVTIEMVPTAIGIQPERGRLGAAQA
jgi:hypothetical protein